MKRGQWPGLIACLVCVTACGLDLERRDGALRVFPLVLSAGTELPAAHIVRVVVEHGERVSELERRLEPEILIESIPAGESRVWVDLSSVPLRTNEARVTVIAGEETRVGLWLLERPDSDEDDDGLTSRHDNCPLAANASQDDGDQDGLGDACDNCPTYPWPQSDLDGDGHGDHCDPDQDGDGTLDLLDACPRDDRGITDSDGDGVCDPVDNCPQAVNPDQVDCDGDGDGDRCDLDIDGDGLSNNEDVCPFSPQETCFDDPSACRVVR